MMKYIVLSFDDGLADFKENALPVLNSFNLKACINVITGYSDLTVATNDKYLSIDEIKKLFSDGFEIAVHTNNHKKPTDYDDFFICKKKLSEWLKTDSFGAIIPFSQKIDTGLSESLRNAHFKYIADHKRNTKTTKSMRWIVLKVFNHFFRNKTRDKLVFFERYYYKKPSLNYFLEFERLPANRDNSPNLIIKAIKNMKSNHCLTVVFHSILNSLNDNCPYPFGAWTKDEFEFFIRYLSSNKNTKVIKQMELITNEKN